MQSDMMVLHRHGFLTGEQADELVSKRYGVLLQHQAETLTTIVDKTLGTIDQIHRDAGLNARGKAERVAQVFELARQELAKRATNGKLQQDLGDALGAMPKGLPGPDTDDVAAVLRDELRAQEIRSHLKEIDPARRDALVMAAAENDEGLELLRAVHTAPVVLGLVPPDTINGAKDRWLQRAKPQPYADLEAVQSAISLYDGNMNRAIEVLRTAHSPSRKASEGTIQMTPAA